MSKISREEELYQNGYKLGYEEGFKTGMQEGYDKAKTNHMVISRNTHKHDALVKFFQIIILMITVILLLYLQIPISTTVTVLAFTYLSHGLVVNIERYFKASEDVKLARHRRRNNR